MKRNNIIVLQRDSDLECWGSLTEICREHGYSHNYLKRLKFPFTYKGWEFKKVPFRAKYNSPR